MTDILLWLILGGVVASNIRDSIHMWLDLRQQRPVRRRKQHQDLADTFVAAAEQRFGRGNGSDKARWARERLMEVAKVSGPQAEALVEFSVKRSK